MNTEKVIVTRHPGLIDYLHEIGFVSEHELIPIISHATAEQVKDKHVIGVLPLHLAAETKLVSEVPLNIPAELRGQELTSEQMHLYAGDIRTYTVSRIQ